LVMKQRGRYFRDTAQAEENLVRSSVATYLYGIALTFLLYLPFILKHGLGIGKIYFLLEFIYLQGLLVLLITLSVKIFRGRGSLINTMAAYCIWVGICSPIFILLSYPIWWHVAFESFIGTPDTDTTRVPGWVLAWALVVYAFIAVAGYMIGMRWIADLHGISRRRLLLSLLVVYMPLMALHNLFLAPYVTQLLKVVSRFLEAIT